MRDVSQIPAAIASTLKRQAIPRQPVGCRKTRALARSRRSRPPRAPGATQPRRDLKARPCQAFLLTAPEQHASPPASQAAIAPQNFTPSRSKGRPRAPFETSSRKKPHSSTRSQIESAREVMVANTRSPEHAPAGREYGRMTSPAVPARKLAAKPITCPEGVGKAVGPSAPAATPPPARMRTSCGHRHREVQHTGSARRVSFHRPPFGVTEESPSTPERQHNIEKVQRGAACLLVGIRIQGVFDRTRAGCVRKRRTFRDSTNIIPIYG